MVSKKLLRLTPVSMLVLISCVSSNPAGTNTVAPMDIGGGTLADSGLARVITAADRAAHQPSPLVTPYKVVHHFASIAPVPAGDVSNDANSGSGGSGATGATGTASATATPTPTPTPSSGSGGTSSGTAGVSTFAGSTPGFLNGTGTGARFNGPVALAIDANKNIYVADTANNCIRKIDTLGNVTTFAGDRTGSGFLNAQGTSAKFNAPTGLAFDASGNLYVADSGNHCLRKITPDGTVSTFANTAGSSGSLNGPVASATFMQPYGIAFYAPTSTFYVSDAGSNLIRAIASGTVSTLAGDGTAGYKESHSGGGSDAEFNHPEGLAVGPGASGTVNVYVADTNNGALRVVSTQGGVTTSLQGTEGHPEQDQLGHPGGVAIFDHYCFVAATKNEQIREFDTTAPPLPAFQNKLIAGTTTTPGMTDGPLTSALFDDPAGIATIASGTLFVVDTTSSRVRKVAF